MSIPNVAVLGLNFGWKSVDVLRKTKMANLLAVCDRGRSLQSEERVKIFKEVAHYTDYIKLLDDLDGKLDGIIAPLPNDLHLPIVEEAAKRGLNILIEKPIAQSIPEAEKIIEIVEKTKIKLLVGHHRRFSAFTNCAKKTIDEGKLGRIVGANMIWAAKKPDDYFEVPWRVKEGTGGPLLINGIHFVDDIRYMIGEISMVLAYVTNEFRGKDVEDTCGITFVCTNGAVVTVLMTDIAPSVRFYEANCKEDHRFHPANYDSYFIFGDKASLSFPSMEMMSYDPDFGEGWTQPFQTYSFPVERIDPMEEELKHFCEVLMGQAEPRTNAADATVNLRVIEAINTSAKTGKAVQL